MLSGIINFTQNIMAFSVLNLLSPLSYSVATATKRILVIAISILTLKNPITPMNSVGMFLAVFGVFLYNRVWYLVNSSHCIYLPIFYAITCSPVARHFLFAHMLESNLEKDCACGHMKEILPFITFPQYHKYQFLFDILKDNVQPS